MQNAAWKKYKAEGGTLSCQAFYQQARAAGAGWLRAKPGPTLADDLEKALASPKRPTAGGSISAPDTKRRKLVGKRFVFTAAQNNTYLHEDFWNSLQHFCRVNDAQLAVSTFTYNINAWENMGGVSKDGDKGDGKDIWYDPRITEYKSNESVHVARSLIFCGELDILPTVKAPLSGLDDYTGTRSGIVPHAKMQMQSMATMKGTQKKLLYTTGAVTQRNYIERKAGQVATFHHVFGAMYVEVADDGTWFARQLNASDDGVFYDLDRVYGPGWDQPALEFGRPIVNLGDIHIEKMDEVALMGALTMLEVLKPEEVFLHDVIDFTNRNHHTIDDPYHLAAEFHNRSSVQGNITQAGRFANGITSYADRVYVVPSNHDQAFKRWLSDADGHRDPSNARFWHSCNARLFAAIEEGDRNFDIFGWAMQACGGHNLNVHYLAEDQSIVRYNIEFGMHGHRGPNGSRGSPRAYRQLGRRANTGHTHSAGIIDGIYTAGVLGSLDMGYNKGPSSWTHSHIVTYPNGKRQIVTQSPDGRWRA